MISSVPRELEVERSVRHRLYGERVALTTEPTPLPPHGPEQLGRLVGGRYRVLEQVGLGGTATVYRAWDERLKRDVAVKIIARWLARDQVLVHRFRREAELSAGLAHPNIVGILDAGTEPRDFIVMEFVPGTDAGTLLQRQGPLAPGQTVHVVAQICHALEYAHDQDVIHHDVSPRNILIRRADHSAKLADFGLASGALDVNAKQGQSVMGTPGYVAPEVLCGAAPSAQSDLYSLGVVAYRLLAGLSRRHGGDARATAPQATAGPRMPPLAEIRPDLPRGLIEAIQRALAHDHEARQGSVAEFRVELLEGQGAPIRLELPSAA